MGEFIARALTISPWAGYARAYIRGGKQADYDAMMDAPLPTEQEQGRVLAVAAWRTQPPNPVQPRLSEPRRSWWTRPTGPVMRAVFTLARLALLVLVVWAVFGGVWAFLVLAAQGFRLACEAGYRWARRKYPQQSGWNCPTCGCQGIRGTRQTCPDCLNMRPRGAR